MNFFHSNFYKESGILVTWQYWSSLVVVSDGKIVATKENLSLEVMQSDELEVKLLGRLDGRLADLQLWDRPTNSKIIYLLGSLISWR
jgi:hypothetical protein